MVWKTNKSERDNKRASRPVSPSEAQPKRIRVNVSSLILDPVFFYPWQVASLVCECQSSLASLSLLSMHTCVPSNCQSRLKQSMWEISLIIASCVRRRNLRLIGLRQSGMSSWIFYILVASYTSARPYVTDWGSASASWWMEAKMARQTITPDSRWVAPVLILMDECAQTGGKMDEESLLIPYWETKLSLPF